MVCVHRAVARRLSLTAAAPCYARFVGRFALALAMGVLVAMGCSDSAFHCAEDQQCVDRGVVGICQSNQYCTFPDGTCPSGQRYGESAGAGLAGVCLMGEVAGTGDGTMGDGTMGDGTMGDGTSGGPADDGVATSSASSGGADETGPQTTTSSPDTGGTTPDDPYNACDDFEDCEAYGGTCLEPDLADVCGLPCDGDAACPATEDGTAPPVCTGAASTIPGVCVIPCGAPGTCPFGMDCVEDDIGLGFAAVCGWD